MVLIATIVLIALLIPIKIQGGRSDAVQDQTDPLSSLSDNPTKEEIIEAVRYVATRYLVDESSLMQTIKCESGFQHAGVFGDSMKAYGVAQFHKDTFEENCDGSYYKAKDQLICMVQMMKKGMGNRWSCWSKYFSN